MPMTDTEQREFLASIGLNPDAPAASSPTVTAPHPPTVVNGVRLGPDGVDPRTIPAADIEFDDRLLDQFASLEGDGLKAASDYVFGLYKSRGRDKDRHSLLHRRITEFIGRVRRSRATGGHVKETIKATRDQRDLAALMAAKGITPADLLALLNAQETQ